MKPAPDKVKAAARLAIATHVVRLLEEARMADNEHFPQLGPKIRAALRSAKGALRNAQRFSPDHFHVGMGQCRICGHYGDDCTGTIGKDQR